ncbi:hypothetical protein ACHAPQ_002170 [Fusarium lateritium]
MASPLGASGQFASESARDYSDVLASSSSESSQSVHSDDSQHESGQNDHDQDDQQHSICPWRTSRFHHQECSLYFDCPSHSIERSLSENGSADQESIHRSPSPEGPRPDNEQDQPSEQTARFSDQELAQVGINRDNAQTTSTGETGDDRDGASATSDLPTNVDDVSGSPLAQEPEQPSPDTPQAANSTDIGSSSQNRRSEPESPSAASDRLQQRHRPSRGTSGTSTTSSQRPQRTYATPSRERMDAPLPSLRPLEEALPPLPRSARPSISSDPQRPRWQPDNEVTYCPICHTQFSFFVRKHHCR